MRTFSIGWRSAAIAGACAAAVTGLIAGVVSARFEGAATAEMKDAGRELFVRQWTANDPQAHGDGLGPVFNANSCVACHSQGGVGGGGDAAHNVVAYEVHPTIRDRKMQKGLVHAFAINQNFVESRVLLKNTFPIIPGGDRVVGNCTVKFEDFDPVRVETTNSIALFGDGLIDRLSESTIRVSHVGRFARQMGREFGGDFQTVGSGRPRILPGGRLGKFGWKAQFATLEEFVAAACANELGLGNPLMQQATPLGKDYCCEQSDLTRQEFRQLVSFVDSIPRPVEVLPKDARQREIAGRGKKLFASIGCAECHTPDLGNVAGVYSDLMLHSVTSKESDGYQHQIIVEVALPHDHPKPDEWRTPPLWGVADSAPYFHDGGSGTLYDAILRHEGDAMVVTKAFKALAGEDQQAVIAFLKTLRAPASNGPRHAEPSARAVAANR
jgi:CxxC motif-containing protein (DUF1111 family)